MRKSPDPLFKPLERHEPDEQGYTIPILKTPESCVDKSCMTTS